MTNAASHVVMRRGACVQLAAASGRRSSCATLLPVPPPWFPLLRACAPVRCTSARPCAHLRGPSACEIRTPACSPSGFASGGEHITVRFKNPVNKRGGRRIAAFAISGRMRFFSAFRVVRAMHFASCVVRHGGAWCGWCCSHFPGPSCKPPKARSAGGWIVIEGSACCARRCQRRHTPRERRSRRG